jgi:hypothetical protein
VIKKLVAGGRVICNEKHAVIGCIVRYKDKNCILTVYHLMKVGNCNVGDKVILNGYKGRIIGTQWDYDLAIIETNAPSAALEFSKLGSAKIGSAYALRDGVKNPCQVLTVGKTFHYLSFAPRSIPLPGDSGSPIIQDSKIVGILASIFYNNATGIAISLKNF